MHQIRVLISGNVTGVSFRAFLKERARELNLKGWVKNNPDRKLEAVFQGYKFNLEKIIIYCHQGSPSSFIKEVRISEEPILEKFSSFSILK